MVIDKVKVVVDLSEIRSAELSIIANRSYRDRGAFHAEVLALVSLCTDAWEQCCLNSVLPLDRDTEASVKTDRITYAQEACNAMFMFFDETQFMDLSDGPVKNYLIAKGDNFTDSDYVGEYLGPDMYKVVYDFVYVCIIRIHREVFHPLFRDAYHEVTEIKKLTENRFMYLLTVEVER